jgi:D-3-phosphoglycerate dehydrogenase / 2-oxoglutarate reductase
MKVLDAGAYVIRTQPLSATTIADARQLKIVSRHGVGYDAVDVPALNNRRIPLCIVGDVNSLSVTEHVILLILACAKRLIRADRSVRACSWEWRNRLEATDIYGKRLLIVGYGRIGGHLARLATGFGMEIHAFDPLLAERGWPEGPVNPAPTLADGLAWADVVSVSVPKAARPILGVEEFLAHEARRHPRQHRAWRYRGRSSTVGGAGRWAGCRCGSRRLRRRAARTRSSAARPRSGGAHAPHCGLTQQAAERMAVSSIQNVLDFFAGRLNSDLIVNKDFRHDQTEASHRPHR